MNVLNCWTRCGVHILQRRVVRRGVLFLAFLIVVGLLLQYRSSDGWTSADYWTSVHTDHALDTHSISPGERKLAIILPADNPSPDLCKVISSAVALGYPAPIIVNWRKDFHTNEDGIGPSQLGKISGTLNYLEWAMSEKAPQSERLTNDDLVLMLDAYDIWLQLPPSVLLNRFFTGNERADRRIAREFGGGVSRGLMRQTVVVSAQKGCMAPRDSISNLHCDGVPESTLPKNVYGLLTDSPLSRILRWKYTRPKYVNSGSFMGPASDVRRYFRRVKDRMDQNLLAMDEGQELGGDQGVFAEIFGEQESWRRRTQQIGPGRDRAQTKLSGEFEYHVGLDYTQELFYPTCYSEHDSYFVSLNDAEEVARESGRLGVSPPRVQGVPRDIEVAERPLSLLDDDGGDDAKRGGRGWGDLPLYVDFWTTAIPVAIHHNAWRDGLKNRRRTWWDKTWYFPYLRRLLQARAKLTETRAPPLVTLPALNGSLDVWPYFSTSQDTAAVLFVRNRNTTKEEWSLERADWGAVCKSSNATMEAKRPWYDEVFRDGKGPL